MLGHQHGDVDGVVLVFARDFIFRVHTRWFKISEERFDEIHYTMMGYYKLVVFVFNLIPYLALRIVILRWALGDIESLSC